MPIGWPSQRPEPKSAWTGASRPIAAISSAELGATGRLAERWFHGFGGGETGQPAIVGVGAGGPPSAGTASRRGVKRIEHRAPPRRDFEGVEEGVADRGIDGADPELRPEEARDL